jgi:PAS domain S-box-containing protein
VRCFGSNVSNSKFQKISIQGRASAFGTSAKSGLGTFTGHGPIATLAGTNIVAKIHYLQLYIAVVLLSVLPLAALASREARGAAADLYRNPGKKVKERTRQLQAENEARRQTEAALRQRESRIRRLLVEANIIGIFIFDLEGRIVEANDAFLQMVGYDREDVAAGRLHWTELTPPEWLDRDLQYLPQLKMTGSLQPFEKEYLRKDGSRVPVLIGLASFEDGGNQGVAFVLDLSKRKQVEAEAREMQMELAHANRLATMRQLSASIAHEVSQPIGAAVTNAQAALRFLEGQPPALEEARQALTDIVNDGVRAAQVINRVRAQIKKAPPRRDELEINGAIREVVELTRGEAVKNGVSVRTELADSLPLTNGDRVQLQQVVLNLIINSIEAMSGVSEGTRDLLISTGKAKSGGVLVVVRDSGPGIAPASANRLFDSFYTTKRDGLGMGLSICHSIIEAHQGQLWATANTPRGARFQFTLPTGQSKD